MVPKVHCNAALLSAVLYNALVGTIATCNYSEVLKLLLRGLGGKLVGLLPTELRIIWHRVIIKPKSRLLELHLY